MPRSTKKTKRGNTGRPANSSSPTPKTERPRVSLASWARDIGLGLAVCLIFFGMLEGALRLLGAPVSDPESDPFVGFSSIRPLFEVKDGKAFTSPSKLRYFNDVSFPVPKAPGTLRIFAFGGSTTYGHPFDGRTAFPRWLDELLKASQPGRRFEVINAGGISYASYRITPLVKEALALGADVIVLYTGHNEFLERRTYQGMFARGRLTTVLSLLEELYIYKVPARLITPLVSGGGRRKSSPASGGAANVGTTLKDEVSAVLDVSGGLDQYHRDDQFARGVVDHFAYNLRRMIQLCENARVPVIMIEPEENLKDFSPFKSQHGDRVPLNDRNTITEMLERARKDLAQSRPDEALKTLDEAVRVDPLFANLHFTRGRALLARARYKEAEDALIKAKDLDICPLRATTPIIGVIRAVAKETGVPLIRFRDLLAARMPVWGNDTGIPGDESFLDHVHPTVEGHQVLAEAILDTLISKGIVTPEASLSAEEKAALYATAVAGMDEGFMALRDLNLAKTLRWAGKKDEARKALRRAAAAYKNSAEIHKMQGSFFLEDRDYEGALKEYRLAVKLSGDDPDMVFSLAAALTAAGQRDEAMKEYRSLVGRGTSPPDAYSNLAIMLIEAGRIEEARQTLETGIERIPDSAPILAAKGLVEAMGGMPVKGVEWMKRALLVEPGNPNYLYNLSGMLALSGNREEALKYFEEAAARGYRKPEHAATDPVFQPIRDDPRFHRALERMR